MIDACIIPDESIPRGEWRGFNATGGHIVTVIHLPIYKRTFGDDAAEAQVTEWRICPLDQRRIAASLQWQRMGYVCGGRKQ